MAQPSDEKCGGLGGTLRLRFSASTQNPESDKHVHQKVFSLVLPQGDTSAINNSRDCVGCHYLCIHRHISSGMTHMPRYLVDTALKKAEL